MSNWLMWLYCFFLPSFIICFIRKLIKWFIETYIYQVRTGLAIFLQLRDVEINEDHPNENKRSLFIQSLPSEIRSPLPPLCLRETQRPTKEWESLTVGKKEGMQGCPDWCLLSWGSWKWGILHEWLEHILLSAVGSQLEMKVRRGTKTGKICSEWLSPDIWGQWL